MSKKIRSIHTQMIASNALIITMLVALIGASVYFGATWLQIRNSQRLNNDLVEAKGKNFDETSRAFKRTINYLTISNELDQALNMEITDSISLDTANRAIKKAITDKSIFFDEIYGWYLYDADHHLRAHQRKRYNKGEKDILFPEMEESWFDPTGQIRSFMLDGRLVYTRKIISYKNLKELGYFIAIYDSDYLDQQLSTILASEKQFAAVFDEYGSLVVHNYPDDATMKFILEEVDFSEVENSQIVKIPKLGRTIVTQYISSYNNWRLVLAVSVKEITQLSDLLLLIIIVVGCFGLLFGNITQVVNSRHIVKPLSHMVQVVNKVEQGDYSQRIPPQPSEEMDILASSFNQMIITTDNLINQVLRHEIKYRDMQLEAMQAQIRPHILYNTLECINWLAEFGRKEDIRKVTIAFSNIMQSLAKGEKFITVREELSYTEDFLAIYKILLEDKFSYSINSQNIPLDDVIIPRLTIQPLVENAVLHGIKKSSEKGKVTVSLASTPDGILISVIDDGVGMDEETVRSINRYAETPDESLTTNFGLGLRNVIDRLWLVYQGKSRFSVTSSLGWGTTIDVFIPLKEDDNELFRDHFG